MLTYLHNVLESSTLLKSLLPMFYTSKKPRLRLLEQFSLSALPMKYDEHFVSAVQVTRLNVDPGDHKAVTQKLRSLPDVTHVLYLGRSSGSAADRDLAADLEGFRSLVAAARAAGCALQMTQFTSAEDLTKGAP